MKEKTCARVSLKLNKSYFIEITELAQKSGIRGRGVLPFTKDHGFEHPNTKGLAKFFRWCVQYYKEQEPLRLAKIAELKAQQQLNEKELHRMGGL